MASDVVDAGGQDDKGPTEVEIDAVIAEFGGDLRAALRALMADIRTLAEDRDRAVSRGYVRRPPAPGRAA
ncbi:MAG: hypothetical protein J0H01_21010 [Rhizobiales bacterium]|nr:hypothetical protein [Hyphomicrobiales bacterium]